MYLLKHRVARTAAPGKRSLVVNQGPQHVERTGGNCNGSCNDTKLVQFEPTEGKLTSIESVEPTSEVLSYSALSSGQWFNVSPKQLLTKVVLFNYMVEASGGVCKSVDLWGPTTVPSCSSPTAWTEVSDRVYTLSFLYG